MAIFEVKPGQTLRDLMTQNKHCNPDSVFYNGRPANVDTCFNNTVKYWECSHGIIYVHTTGTDPAPAENTTGAGTLKAAEVVPILATGGHIHIDYRGAIVYDSTGRNRGKCRRDMAEKIAADPEYIFLDRWNNKYIYKTDSEK